MATIRAAVQLYDGMSPALRSMNNAMNTIINSFESMQRVSSNAVDTRSIQAARAELNNAEASLRRVDEAVQRAGQSQRRFNDDIRSGSAAAGDLENKIKAIVVSLGTLFGLKQILGLSDEMSQITARLNLMNDSLQTTAELQQKIMDSANRTGSSYRNTANMVSKLGIQAGKAFSSNQELIAFAEQLNKAFTVSGADETAIQSTMYNLTQALSLGKLQGQDLRIVRQNAATIMQNIADYMGKSTDQIQELAKEGEISATVVKNAVLAAADETNAKFAEMPVTFSNVMNRIKNNAIEAFQPLLKKISEITSDPRFVVMVQSWGAALGVLADIASQVFNVLSRGAAFVFDNWSLIGPIISVIAGAMFVYAANAMAAFIATGLVTGAKMLYVFALSIVGIALEEATIAQWGLNTAMYANPVGIVIAAILVFIGIIYLAVKAINHWKGTTYSAAGVIVGALKVMVAHIYNSVIVPLWNYFAALANFFMNVFKDPVAAVKILFLDMAITVVGYINNMAKAIEDIINQIPGVQVSITSGLGNFLGKLESAREKVKEGSQWEEVVKSRDFMDYGEAYKSGYNWGVSLENKFKSLTNFDDGSGNIPDIAGDAAKTAGNTGKMADSMEIAEEDLKYLRDLAEQEAVNRFTTAEISIEMTNANTISSNMDIDGVVSRLEEKVYDTMLIAAEGVHV